MKCLVIAAGKGSRLRLKGDSKPLIPILGVPLIERVIRPAREFRCIPAIFGALERCAEESGDTRLSGAVRVLPGEGRAKAVDINDSQNIVTPGDGRSTLRPYVLNV